MVPRGEIHTREVRVSNEDQGPKTGPGLGDENEQVSKQEGRSA
jgi:hypothetical protein